MNPMVEVATTYETLSISDLRLALLEPVTETALRFRGWVLENLSIDPNTRLKPWRNGTRWINITDQEGHKAKVCISSSVWNRAVEKGYEITNDVAIDVALATIGIDKWMQIQIEALAVRVTGQSRLEALRENIFRHIEQRGYLTRIKKPLPVVIRKVAIITTVNSTIESDIVNQINIRKEFVSDFRFDGSAAHLKTLIEDIGHRREHDIIALYRGGREDEYMFVFSDPMVLDALVQSPVPVVTAIGHERDVPPVQQVADMGFASPTKFAEFVRQRNDEALLNAQYLMDSINRYFFDYIAKIEKNNLLIMGNINAVANNLQAKDAERKEQAAAKRYRRNIILIVAVFSLILLAIILFFLWW